MRGTGSQMLDNLNLKESFKERLREKIGAILREGKRYFIIGRRIFSENDRDELMKKFNTRSIFNHDLEGSSSSSFLDEERSLEFMGLITFKDSVNKESLMGIAQLKAADFRLVYLSSDDELKTYSSTFALNIIDDYMYLLNMEVISLEQGYNSVRSILKLIYGHPWRGRVGTR